MHGLQTAVTALAVMVSASSVAIATPFPPWHWQPGPQTKSMSAMYFLRVDPAGSSVVAIGVDNNGKLTDKTSSTYTGGVGLQSKNATAPGEAVVGVDPLQGQQAVSIGDNLLFTVNSGSDTAVMMGIDPFDPLQLHMIGEPVSSLGSFPMAITYSSKLKLACVLNGGSTSGVACYHVNPFTGLIPDGKGLRKFPYDFVTPPVLGGPKGSGSDIQFNPDSTKIITVLKGDTTPATLGYINVFDIEQDGSVPMTYTDAGIEPLAGPFGFAFDTSDQSTLFVSDAAFGGAVISLDEATNKATLVGTVNSTSFSASCWAVYSETTESFYNLNAGAPVIGQINPASGALEKVIDFDAPLAGALDAVVVGSTLYFLTGINEIGVLDLTTGEILQTFTYGTAEDRPFWTGLAMYSTESGHQQPWSGSKPWGGPKPWGHGW